MALLKIFLQFSIDYVWTRIQQEAWVLASPAGDFRGVVYFLPLQGGRKYGWDRLRRQAFLYNWLMVALNTIDQS